MAPRLGSLFLTAALGPLQYAGQCIMARRVEDGLRQIAGDDVLAAFHRGIAAVAKEVGVTQGTVASLLPVQDMAALAARIAENQRHAVAQWNIHAGDTGLLDGVADLTVDGRAPDASLCLLRLSAKMKLDKALAVPLRELSEDLDRWQQLLDACRILIEDGEALKQAHRRRRLIRFGLAAAGALALAAVIVWFTRVSLARARIDEALAATDPCQVSVTDADRAKASDEQETALASKAEACEAHRKAERERREAEEKRREEERRAAAARAAMEARCEKVARAAAGEGSADGLEPPAAQLVRRIAEGALEPADLEIATAAIPCKDAAAFPQLAGAYTTAALNSVGAWMQVATPSDGATTLFAKGKDGVPEQARFHFGGHVERYAEKALLSGNDETVARARALCHAAAAIGHEARPYCRKILESP